MKDDYTTNSHYITYTLLLTAWENVLFELGSERLTTYSRGCTRAASWRTRTHSDVLEFALTCACLVSRWFWCWNRGPMDGHSSPLPGGIGSTADPSRAIRPVLCVTLNFDRTLSEPSFLSQFSSHWAQCSRHICPSGIWLGHQTKMNTWTSDIIQMILFYLGVSCK